MRRGLGSFIVLVALLGGCLRTRPHGVGPSGLTPTTAADGDAVGDAAADSDAEPGTPAPDGETTPDAAGPDGSPAKGAAIDAAPGPDPATAGSSFRAPLTYARPSPATRLAMLSPGACMKELTARSLPFTRSKQAAAGVATPLRSSGPMHGVRIVIPRAPSLFGVVDCRAALALDEVAKVAAAHGVVELQVDNAYRPKAHLPGKKAARSQHAYGLALDVTQVKLRDGTVLRVEPDWHAPIGSVSCGPDARMDDPTPASIALRDLVCDLARSGIFHHMLSPSYDAAHRNHLHLDIARNASRQAMH